MIIAIDISQLVYQGSGVANYTYNLVKNLLLYNNQFLCHSCESRNPYTYKLFFAAKNPLKKYLFLEEFKHLGAKIYRYPIPMKLQKFLWQKNDFLSINRLIGQSDIFYSSDFLRPKTDKNVKGITTIHDLSWKLYPKYHTDDVIKAHEKKLEKTIKYNDEIIVDSENTKNDLLRLYPQIKEEKVHVIYPGVGEHFRKIEDKKVIEKVIKKYLKSYKLQVTSYTLYVGAIEPRKNLDVAIKVFNKLIIDSRLRGNDRNGKNYRKNCHSCESRNPLIILRWQKHFNFSSVCNFGAEKSRGEYLLFLNNDTEIITPDWIEGMMENEQRKEIGAVGCKLLYPDGRIQHAGVILGIKGGITKYGIAGHAFKYFNNGDNGQFFQQLHSIKIIQQLLCGLFFD